MKPDSGKIQDLRQISEATDKTELQQFLGLMAYLSRFIKDFSSKTAVLRDLLHKDSEFPWEPHHQRVFEDMQCEMRNLFFTILIQNSRSTCTVMQVCKE